MMDHTASKPGCPRTALPPGGRRGPRPGWQRPKNLSQRQAWTVTYGQIIFTLTPFFAQCCISHRRCRRRRAAQRWAALVLLLSLTPLLKSPQNPNDLGALLHSFSLLGVLSSSNFFLLLAQYECWTGNAFLFHSLNFT